MATFDEVPQATESSAFQTRLKRLRRVLHNAEPFGFTRDDFVWLATLPPVPSELRVMIPVSLSDLCDRAIRFFHKELAGRTDRLTLVHVVQVRPESVQAKASQLDKREHEAIVQECVLRDEMKETCDRMRVKHEFVSLYSSNVGIELLRYANEQKFDLIIAANRRIRSSYDEELEENPLEYLISDGRHPVIFIPPP